MKRLLYFFPLALLSVIAACFSVPLNANADDHIISISPAEMPVTTLYEDQNSSRELTITGINFNAGARVRIGGNLLSATFISPTQLRVAVPVSLLRNPAKINIRVVDSSSTTSLGSYTPEVLKVTNVQPDINGIDPCPSISTRSRGLVTRTAFGDGLTYYSKIQASTDNGATWRTVTAVPVPDKGLQFLVNASAPGTRLVSVLNQAVSDLGGDKVSSADRIVFITPITNVDVCAGSQTTTPTPIQPFPPPGQGSVPLAPAPGQQTSAGSLNFNLGSSGDQVSRLQQNLIELGYHIPAGTTGYFGPQTLDAVKEFQQHEGLSPSSSVLGKVGPWTLDRLREALNSPPATAGTDTANTPSSGRVSEGSQTPNIASGSSSPSQPTLPGSDISSLLAQIQALQTKIAAIKAQQAQSTGPQAPLSQQPNTQEKTTLPSTKTSTPNPSPMVSATGTAQDTTVGKECNPDFISLGCSQGEFCDDVTATCQPNHVGWIEVTIANKTSKSVSVSTYPSGWRIRAGLTPFTTATDITIGPNTSRDVSVMADFVTSSTNHADNLSLDFSITDPTDSSVRLENNTCHQLTVVGDQTVHCGADIVDNLPGNLAWSVATNSGTSDAFQIDVTGPNFYSTTISATTTPDISGTSASASGTIAVPAGIYSFAPQTPTGWTLSSNTCGSPLTINRAGTTSCAATFSKNTSTTGNLGVEIDQGSPNTAYTVMVSGGSSGSSKSLSITTDQNGTGHATATGLIPTAASGSPTYSANIASSSPMVNNCQNVAVGPGMTASCNITFTQFSSPPTTASCTTAANCPTGQTCSAGMCVTAATGQCGTDADCGGGMVCMAGVCAPSPVMPMGVNALQRTNLIASILSKMQELMSLLRGQK